LIQKRFISYSLIIHLLAVSLLFITPAVKEQKGKPFFTRLVTADEIGLEAGGPAADKSPKVLAPPALPRIPKAVSKPQAAAKLSIPSPKSSASQSAKTQESPAASTAPSGVMAQGTENSKGSQLSIPPGTGGGGAFPLKRETIDNAIQKGKVFSVGKSAKEAGVNIAKKTEAQKEKSSITFEVKGFKYDGYMMRLKDKIEGIWHYPSDAAMRGLYGDLYLNFTIKKDGSLGKVELVRTSGYRSLDDAAMRALKDAAPYWPLPEDWKEEELSIKGHFIYTIYGIYVR